MFKVTLVWAGVLCMIFTNAQARAASSDLLTQESEVQHSLPDSGEKQAEPHVEEGRVKINLAIPEMVIAEDNKVPLDLHGFAASRIMAGWKFLKPTIESETIAEPEEVTLQHNADGSVYLNFVPVRLGQLQLRISVSFQDGGFDSASVNVNVDRLPEQAPLRLILSDPAAAINFQRKAGTLHIPLSRHSPNESLIPVAFYQNVSSPIPLYPIPAALLRDIVFSITTKNNQPSPIAFDSSTGEVKPVRPGDAFVEATLHGKSAYACVDVTRTVDWNERSNCDSFLPAGLTEPIDEPMQEPKRAGP